MSEPVDNAEGKKVRNLTDAIRRVRTAEAERSDVVVELRDAEKARLDLLAEELKSVFDDVPEDNDTFLFNVAPGTPPRLWIDMTAFVAMGRDRRTYRFLKDTRIGRTVILETAKAGDMAAFDRIYHTYNRKLYAFSLSILKDPDNAREMVQDVFVNLWQVGCF